MWKLFAATLILLFGLGVLFLFVLNNLPRKNRGIFSGSGCTNNPAPIFTHFPTDMTKVVQISPPLIEVASGTKPHSYIEVTERVPVYAPVNSQLVTGAKYSDMDGEVAYILQIDVSCEVYYYFDHIEPTDEIKALFTDIQDNTRSVSIAPLDLVGGQLLGYTTAEGRHRFDFGVINNTKTTVLADNPQFSISDKYVHATCLLDYYEDSQKEQLQGLLGYNNFSDLRIIDNLCD